MSNNTPNQREVKSKDSQGFIVTNTNAAGIDIGSKEHWVCVPADRCEKNIRKFGTFTSDLHTMANWLKECQVTTVAMEATGVLWIPPFQILEEAGLDVCLANPKHCKNVPGRPKTDRYDCQWLQRLHSCGLIMRSFRPEDDICKVRAYVRYRQSLIEENAVNIHHMHKALEQMNIRLGLVVSDITGVTGLAIIDAILDGERDPHKLLELKDRRIKASEEDICKALVGDYRKEHLFMLKIALERYRSTIGQLGQCDQEIAHCLEEMFPEQEQKDQLTFDFAESLPNKSKRKPAKNAVGFAADTYLYKITGVDLTQIPGIHENNALSIIAETGLDMSQWATDKHFASWLGLSPNRKISGGKVLSSATRKVQNRAAHAFRMAALALKYAHCHLGAFFRRIAAKRDFSKAVTATARKIATIFYHMLKDGKSFVELGQDFYEQQYREQRIKSLQRQAASLGFQLVTAQATNSPS